MTQLPFGFARRFGAAGMRRNRVKPCAACRYTAHSSRGSPPGICSGLPVRVLATEVFAARLAAAYREGQSAAEQVAQGLDEELDLLSLVDKVPQTADLLEQQGDAPIIR